MIEDGIITLEDIRATGRRAAQKFLSAQEAIIVSCLPARAALEDITRQVTTDGTTLFLHKGKPFMRLLPMSFETVREGNSYKIVATQQYRKLP